MSSSKIKKNLAKILDYPYKLLPVFSLIRYFRKVDFDTITWKETFSLIGHFAYALPFILYGIVGAEEGTFNPREVPGTKNIIEWYNEKKPFDFIKETYDKIKEKDLTKDLNSDTLSIDTLNQDVLKLDTLNLDTQNYNNSE